MQDNGVGMLVVGSRGMGALARSLMGLVGLGSVSDYVVHHAHCPVAVIKEVTTQLAATGEAGGDQ